MGYFYYCSYMLGKNSIVKKGNWGRLCKFENDITIEETFERIRRQEFPNRPSRLECNFICSTLKSAKNFFVENPERRVDLLYEVEIVNPKCNIFETDWTLINRKLLDTKTKQENAARKYWNPKHVEENRKEILVDGDIRILRQVKQNR
jgi:hypothetical protein